MIDQQPNFVWEIEEQELLSLFGMCLAGKTHLIDREKIVQIILDLQEAQDIIKDLHKVRFNLGLSPLNDFEWPSFNQGQISDELVAQLEVQVKDYSYKIPLDTVHLLVRTLVTLKTNISDYLREIQDFSKNNNQ